MEIVALSQISPDQVSHQGHTLFTNTAYSSN